MTQATGYVRVSTPGQAVEGVSVEMQEAKIRQWAALNDAELVGLHVDEGLSGKNTVRPGLQEALLEVKKHKGALVVYSLSRLSRSTRDTLELADSSRKWAPTWWCCRKKSIPRRRAAAWCFACWQQ